MTARSSPGLQSVRSLEASPQPGRGGRRLGEEVATGLAPALTKPEVSAAASLVGCAGFASRTPSRQRRGTLHLRRRRGRLPARRDRPASGSARPRDVLFEGDYVRTSAAGGSAEVLFDNDGTLFTVRPGTMLKVQRDLTDSDAAASEPVRMEYGWVDLADVGASPVSVETVYAALHVEDRLRKPRVTFEAGTSETGSFAVGPWRSGRCPGHAESGEKRAPGGPCSRWWRRRSDTLGETTALLDQPEDRGAAQQLRPQSRSRPGSGSLLESGGREPRDTSSAGLAQPLVRRAGWSTPKAPFEDQRDPWRSTARATIFWRVAAALADDGILGPLESRCGSSG